VLGVTMPANNNVDTLCKRAKKHSFTLKYSQNVTSLVGSTACFPDVGNGHRKCP
jgi:hypothetical protein